MTLVVNGDYAVSISNNAVVDITAPSTGNYAGIALFGLRTASKWTQHTFSNNVVVNITGAIYFPNQILNFSNNFSPGVKCTQIIARIIYFANNVYLDHDCAGTGVKPIGGTSSQLVE